MNKNSSKLKLVTRNDLPAWLLRESSPYIFSGYRKPGASWISCLATLFSLHNESVNVLSHALGALYFGHLITVHTLTIANDAARTVMLSFAVSIEVCLISSATFHLLHPYSPRAASLLLRIDLGGILVGCCGCYAPGFYFGLFCYPGIARRYVFAVAWLAAVCLALQLHPQWSQPSWRIPRNALYATVMAFGMVPTVHWISLVGMKSAEFAFFVPKIAMLYLLVGVASAFYLSGWPESQWPGRFDMFLASHQLWHVLILLAFVYWYDAAVDMMQYRNENPCPAGK